MNDHRPGTNQNSTLVEQLAISFSYIKLDSQLNIFIKTIITIFKKIKKAKLGTLFGYNLKLLIKLTGFYKLAQEFGQRDASFCNFIVNLTYSLWLTVI